MKKALIIFSVVALLATYALPATAQCSMCRRVAETNHESKSNKVGKSLNSGILYLLAVPYVLGAVGFVFWWKNRKSE